MKKSQVVSLDFLVSIVVFVSVLSVFVGIVLHSRQKSLDKAVEEELEYVFLNLENNLDDTGYDFLSDYRVSSESLYTFADDFADQDIDDFVLGSYGDKHGIGLNGYIYDSCIYFVDNDGSFIELSGYKAIGLMEGGTCSDSLVLSQNPCKDYKDSVSLGKPVLFDEGNQEDNRIVLMTILLCEK